MCPWSSYPRCGGAGAAKCHAFWLLDRAGKVLRQMNPQTACDCEYSLAFTFELRGMALVARTTKYNDYSMGDGHRPEREDEVLRVARTLATNDPERESILTPLRRRPT